MGSSRGFAPVESDYTTVTKYNCLIHRVQLLSKMKVLSLIMGERGGGVMERGRWGSTIFNEVLNFVLFTYSVSTNISLE